MVLLLQCPQLTRGICPASVAPSPDHRPRSRAWGVVTSFVRIMEMVITAGQGYHPNNWLTVSGVIIIMRSRFNKAIFLTYSTYTRASPGGVFVNSQHVLNTKYIHGFVVICFAMLIIRFWWFAWYIKSRFCQSRLAPGWLATALPVKYNCANHISTLKLNHWYAPTSDQPRLDIVPTLSHRCLIDVDSRAFAIETPTLMLSQSFDAYMSWSRGGVWQVWTVFLSRR